MRRSAVIGAVLVAVVLTGCGDSTGTDSGSEELSPTSTIAAVATESTTVPTTDAVPTTIAETQTISPQEALDVSESFIAAHNAGDFVAVLALFTEGAIFSDTHTSQSARPDWEPRLVWDIAGEEMLLSHECVVTDDVPGVT
jgi:hypothetical protein